MIPAPITGIDLPGFSFFHDRPGVGGSGLKSSDPSETGYACPHPGEGGSPPIPSLRKKPFGFYAMKFILHTPGNIARRTPLSFLR